MNLTYSYRCDRSHPCEHCGLSGIACTYASGQNAPGTKHLTSVFSQHDISAVPLDSQFQVSKAGSGTPTSTEMTQTVQRLIEKVRELEEKLSKGSLASPEPSYTDTSPLRAPIKGVFQKTRYFGQSHWMNCIPAPFQLIIDLCRLHEADPTSEIYSLLQKCKSASREVRARDKILSTVAPHLGDCIPARGIADKLVQSYLETFESIYRVLHVPNFLLEYEGYWLQPRTASLNLVTKLLLIMAIGAVFQPQGEAAMLRSSALQWIYAAQAWLSTPFDKHRLTVEGLQIQCLLLLARLAHDVDGDLLWLSAGYLLRTAMQMGLHIDAESYTFRNLPAQDIQLRRKLWATVLEIVVQTSVDSGGLPLISANDYDCKPPLNVDDMVQKEGSDDLRSTVKSHDKFTQSSLQIMLVGSLPLRLEIAAFVNDFRVDSMTYDKTIHLSEKLLKVCSTNSASFQTYKISSSRPTEFQVTMVELLTHRFLFVLHYPYALKARSNHTFYYSRKVCLDSALLFLSHSSQTQDYAYTHLRLWGGGLFRVLPLQSTGFIAEELFHQIETEAASFSKNMTLLDRRSELRKYIEEYAEFTIARIRYGHTNVRGHAMFSALLAQVDAVLSGSPVEESILVALKNSLTTCYEVLRAQSRESPPQSSPFECGTQIQHDMRATTAIPLQGDITVRRPLFLIPRVANPFSDL